MIELKNLTKSYSTKHGRKYVFRNINATFPADKSIGILGPNGAGKSTLLRIIGGVDYPDSGRVFTTKRISMPVGLAGGFQGSLTGRDNVKFVCRIYSIVGDQMQEAIAFVQEFADIGKYFDLPTKTYSTGMRARVAFGISMAIDFDYYLIDEVTSVGDPSFRQKSLTVFQEKRKNAKVIMVSHDIRKLRDHCDMGVFIKNGEVLVFENLNEAIRLYSKL